MAEDEAGEGQKWEGQEQEKEGKQWTAGEEEEEEEEGQEQGLGALLPPLQEAREEDEEEQQQEQEVARHSGPQQEQRESSASSPPVATSPLGVGALVSAPQQQDEEDNWSLHGNGCSPGTSQGQCATSSQESVLL